jgi:glycosyltransferase involved in cell wall biosynthesis
VSGPKLLFVVTEDWYFHSHRLGLARAARDAGFEPVLATRCGRHVDEIRSSGIRVLPLDVPRNGKSPMGELRAVHALYRIYRSERPDIVHHVALKPVVYGSLAAAMAGVPAVVNAVAGLGHAFTSRDATARILRLPLSAALRGALNRYGSRTIVQNPDDRRFLVERLGVAEERVMLIRGAGVDLARFAPVAEPAGPVLVICAARMLRGKGIEDFVAAAGRLRREGMPARFAIVGGPDPGNPGSISRSRLEAWHRSGDVEWWGHRDDMPSVLASAHVICLPSYYGEGVPKVLLEAAACARPIVTTDVPGCREVVSHGENGLLLPPRDVTALGEALGLLIMDPRRRAEMGACGRARAETLFDERQVTSETLRVYAQLRQ